LSAKQQVDLLIRVALDEISAARTLQEQKQHPPGSPRCFAIQLPSPPSQPEEPGKVKSESTMAMDDVSCFCHINRCAIEFFSVAVAMIECMMGRCSMIW
jgi:hypothetical protein